AAERPSWRDLLAYCQRMCAGKLTGRWLNDARRWHAAVGPASFKARVLRWFPLVDRTRPESIGRSVDDGSRDLPIPKPHSDLLRGLAWCCVLQPDRDLVRALGNLALSAYRKVPRRGPRAVALGNACIAALGMMEEAEVLGQLVVLRSRIKFGTARKEIGKALETTAMRLGLPPEEVEELGVPDYGLTEVGRLAVPMGAFTAELTVADDGATTLAWRAPGGTPQKTVPAAVKQSHAEALKELKATARDIEAMTAAQRDRIDNLFLARKSWPLEAWRQRYMDHPIVGRIARRLLWTFTTAGRTTDGIVHEGQIVGRDDRPIEGLGPGTSVALWHPIDHATDEVLAWRSWLEAHGVRQPFKQAHREVYVLTEAERQTRVYSNRFAAHVLRQHQFNALCGVRGWKNQLRLMVDDTYPPATLHLPRWGLRAEFWVEGAGDAYGRDTTETGTYLHLTTDQVRFYPIAAAQRFAHAGGGGYHRGPRADDDEPMALEDVPALVVSEVMRDVDLFVGVASVGNDPTWSDGGPEGRYVDYWRSYSFGDLSATAQTRKSVLQRLIPRLKIADRCSLGDRFLVVRGDLRTYKIHLGSGNILMEPGDEYLCIVPKQAPAGAGASPVFLPFEGDATLAIIVSKALLLAEDRKITDRTITSQIRRGL
ncbi:MAG TPA: DUF4132 domain-containing protein, partial [Isosphaeraceae bacterium]